LTKHIQIMLVHGIDDRLAVAKPCKRKYFMHKNRFYFN